MFGWLYIVRKTGWMVCAVRPFQIFSGFFQKICFIRQILQVFSAVGERRFALERKTKTRKTRARRVKKGYETLTFGGIEDAVRLLFCEDLKPEDLEGLDLYNVAEIRRPRGGGMEIKFFDRIKALQCLERMETEAGQPSLFEALEAGARALNKGEPDET